MDDLLWSSAVTHCSSLEGFVDVAEVVRERNDTVDVQDVVIRH